MSTHAHVYEGMFAYVKLIQLYVITNIKIYIYKQIYTHMHTYMRCREEGGGEDKLKITFRSVTRLNLRKVTTMDQDIQGSFRES